MGADPIRNPIKRLAVVVELENGERWMMYASGEALKDAEGVVTTTQPEPITWGYGDRKLTGSPLTSVTLEGIGRPYFVVTSDEAVTDVLDRIQSETEGYQS